MQKTQTTMMRETERKKTVESNKAGKEPQFKTNST